VSIRLLVQPKRSALWYRRTTCAARTRQFVWRNEWERGQCDVRVPDRGDGARDDRVVGEFDRSPSISGGVRGGLMVMSITRVLPLVGRGHSRNTWRTRRRPRRAGRQSTRGGRWGPAGPPLACFAAARNTQETHGQPAVLPTSPPSRPTRTTTPSASPPFQGAPVTPLAPSSRPAPSATSAASLFHEGKLSRPTAHGRCSPHLSALGLSQSPTLAPQSTQVRSHAPAGNPNGQTNSVSGNRPNRIVTSDP
jgi:hypothetical protein